MYCPKCHAEYRERFTECSDCHIQLLAEMPPEMQRPGDPGLELVTVLEGGDPPAIAAVKNLLEEAGIPFCIRRYAPVGAFARPWRRIQVSLDRETEARAVVQRMTVSSA